MAAHPYSRRQLLANAAIAALRHEMAVIRGHFSWSAKPLANHWGAEHEEIDEHRASQDQARQVGRRCGARARGSSGAAIYGAAFNGAPNARFVRAAEAPLG